MLIAEALVLNARPQGTADFMAYAIAADGHCEIRDWL